MSEHVTAAECRLVYEQRRGGTVSERKVWDTLLAAANTIEALSEDHGVDDRAGQYPAYGETTRQALAAADKAEAAWQADRRRRHEPEV